jgi:hypothetical protein
MAIFRNVRVRLRFESSKYFNIFLRLKSSPSLTLQKISHSRIASYHPHKECAKRSFATNTISYTIMVQHGIRQSAQQVDNIVEEGVSVAEKNLPDAPEKG